MNGAEPSQSMGALHSLGREVASRVSFSTCLTYAAMHMGQSDADIADQIGICRGYMSRFMRSVAQGWATRLVEFMTVTQSIAPLEWIADRMGFDVVARGNKPESRD